MARKKNKAAVSLGKRRMANLTPEERAELARKAGKARLQKMTSEQRREIASLAGKAGGRGRAKKKAKVKK